MRPPVIYIFFKHITCTGVVVDLISTEAHLWVLSFSFYDAQLLLRCICMRHPTSAWFCMELSREKNNSWWCLNFYENNLIPKNPKPNSTSEIITVRINLPRENRISYIKWVTQPTFSNCWSSNEILAVPDCLTPEP